MSPSAFSKLAIATAISLSLMGCGSGFGGGSSTSNTDTNTDSNTDNTTPNTGTTPNNNNTGNGENTTEEESKAAYLEISASSYQLMSDGATPITISAITKDIDNIILDNIDLKITVDGYASVTPVTGTSLKTSILTPGLNHPENRTLTVSAETLDGSQLKKQLKIDVVGTEVLIDGPSGIGINKKTHFTIKLKDSNGKALAGHLVDVSGLQTSITPVDGDNFITDSNGELKIQIEAGQSGEEVLTASSLGATASKTIIISGDSFTLTSPNNEIPVGTAEAITLNISKDNTPRQNIVINITSTRGKLYATAEDALSNNSNKVISSVTSDSLGNATFYSISHTAGLTEITATATDDGHTTSIQKEFIATTPSYINIQSEKSSVAPLGSTSIIATVRDKNDNPVKNQVLVFNLNDTVNGTLSNNKATTDSLGRATIVYTAGDTTSAYNGVNISTYIENSNTINDSLNLSVGGQALRLVLGTNNKVEVSGVNYIVNYGVIVTDSTGNPVANQRVEFSISPISYVKAGYKCTDDTWHLVEPIMCDVEDKNRNGKIDSNINTIKGTEDINNNGRLEPTNTASISTNAVTDKNGLVTVPVTYPQSEAWWSFLELTASVNVNGTESSEKTQFILPIESGEIKKCSHQPSNFYGNNNANTQPGVTGMSKYGSAKECANPS